MAKKLGNLDNQPELMPEKLIRRFEKLTEIRRLWEPDWQEIADYVLPAANDVVTRKPPGNKRTNKLYDSTAIFASELLAASIHGTLTSSYSRWFSLQLPDQEINENSEVKTWMDECATRLYLGFNESNFSQEVHEMYTTLAPFGTGVLLFEEKEEEKGAFQFKSIRLQDSVIAEGANGKVNSVFRNLPMTRSSIIERWPDSEDLEIFKLNPDGDPDKSLAVIHAVVPVPKAKIFKFASVYLLGESKAKLETQGYYEFPYMVPRWSKQTGETYGRGRGHTALPDIRTLNKMVEMELRALGKVINPPMKARGGDVIGQVKLNAGGISTVRDMDSLQALFPSFDYKPVNLKIQDLKGSVRQMFYSDQLELQNNNPQMTATEVNVRYELMQRILGPTLGRLESEFLDDVIARAFKVMLRAGRLPPIPAILKQNKSVLNVRYEGPLARAQKSADVEAVQKLEALLEPLLPTQPQLMDNVDMDGIVRHSAEVLGIPARFIRDNDQVQATRKETADAAAQQQQQQGMAAHAQAAGQAAPLVKALGQAPEPGSPLQQMQQQQQGASGGQPSGQQP